MSSHRIHLKGPWDYRWLQPEFPGNEATSGSVNMPRDWRSLFGDQAGIAQFRRRFHRPTNLEPHEQVMIVLTEVRGDGTIWLNDRELGIIRGAGGLIEFDVTTLMKSFNQLVIDLRFDPSSAGSAAGGLFGVVALEIRTRSLELNSLTP